MQVEAVEPGHAVCRGRGVQRRVNTALVGAVRPGDWVLVFLDNAQEKLDDERAREIDATLDLLDAATRGEAHDTAAAFALPSRLSPDQLRALTGAPAAPSTESASA